MKIKILTSADKYAESAIALAAKLNSVDIPVYYKSSSDKLGAKIREAETEGFTLILIGGKEVIDNTITIKHSGKYGTFTYSEAVAFLKELQ